MRRLTQTEFISRSKLVHGDKFSYHKTKFVTTRGQVIITCPVHGDFEQTANNHLRGAGCLQCSDDAKKLTLDEFITRSKSVHNDVYDYSEVVYCGVTEYVTIKCPMHGEFKQTPFGHMQGYGCIKCGSCKAPVSKAGTDWLTCIGIPDDDAHREVFGLIPNRKYTVDGFDPNTNTVYEFHGDYWHGNPKLFATDEVNPHVGKTYGQLYEAMLEKKRVFESHGFKYLYVWESDQSVFVS